MTKVYLSSVTLHQQHGSLSLQAFAEREGMTLKQVQSFIRQGLILGAQQDGRSKRWRIYPPAKLLRAVREYKRKAGRSSDITEARAGAHGFIVGIPEGGNSPAPIEPHTAAPAVSLPGAFDVEAAHAQPEPRARAEHGERLGAVAPVVMTTRQCAMVVALVSEYLRDTEDWLSVRDKNSLEALIDTLQGAAS